MIFTREKRFGAGLVLAAALCLFAPQEIRASVAEIEPEGVMGQSIREEMESETEAELDLDSEILAAASRSGMPTLLGASGYSTSFLENSFTTEKKYSTGYSTYYHNAKYEDDDLIYGIDVSYWQSKGQSKAETRKVSALDWEKIHKAGIDYAFVRVGYRSLAAGTLNLDDCADSHIQGAMANDINVGVYIFSQAITVKEAEEEADYVLAILEDHPDWDITMPVVFDAETTSGGRLAKAKLSKSKMTSIAEAFCEKIADAGYTPMVYGGINMFGTGMDGTSLAKKYKLWFARYNFTTTSNSKSGTAYSDVSYGYEFWQYCSTAKVSGYSGNLDINFWYKDTSAKTTGLKMTANTTTSVTLKWSGVEDATGYRVYRYDAEQDKYVYIGATKKTSYTDSGLNAGTEYTYKVRCYWKIGGTNYYGTYSSELKVPTILGMVEDLTIDESTSDTMAISWKAVKGADGYRIYQYDPDEDKFAVIDEVEADETDYEVDGLASATEYQFKVAAYMTTDETVYRGALSEVSAGVTRPAKGKELLASTESATEIALSWGKVARATGYQIYRLNTATDKYEKVATVKGSSTLTYMDSGLSTGKTYTYKVRAYKTYDGTNYYGKFSETSAATTKPAKVKTLKLTTKSSAVTLKWSKVGGATGYRIYRLNKKTGKYEKIATVKGATTCTYKITKLKKGASYQYKVRAYRTYNGSNYYGSFSTAQKITVK